MKKVKLLVLALCASVLVHAQTINTVAGDGTPAFGGDTGPATAAQMNGPYCIAFDAAGNYCVSEQYNAVIRRISAGIINTFAGGGSSLGNGGQAGLAQFQEPGGIVFDRAGNLYIADVADNRIRKVNTAGIIYPVSGIGTHGYAGDNGPASSAQINQPTGLVIDRAGNLLFSDRGNNSIRKINTTTDTITTIAGTGTAGYSGDGGHAATAQLRHPTGLAMDDAGNLYIADGNSCIRRIDTAGIITTVAGTDTAGYSGDGGPATAARLAYPVSIAFDHFGNYYISDRLNHNIRKVNAAGIISTIAGNDTAGFRGDGGPATAAEFHYPAGIAIDGLGNLYVADDSNSRARVISCITRPVVPPIAGPDTLCRNSSFTYTNAVSGGTWAASNGNGFMAAGELIGLLPGLDTISYTVSGACGTTIVKKKVYIKQCPRDGVAEVEAAESITLSPNPTADHILIHTASGNIEHVVITNLLGKELLNKAYNMHEAELSLSSYPPGMYLVRVNEWQVFKVVKE